MSHYELTSQSACFLYSLVDLLEAIEQFLVVVTANFVAADQILIEVVQLTVPLPHTLPVCELQA